MSKYCFAFLLLIMLCQYLVDSYLVCEEVKSDHHPDSFEDEIRKAIAELSAKVSSLQDVVNKHINKTGCPDGWLVYGGSCYYLDHQSIVFEKAKELCKHLGGYLVHVDTAAEHEFLKSYMLTHFKNETSYSRSSFWLGLTYASNEGIWKWLDDGTKAVFLDWYQGEPNGARSGENCAVYHGNFIPYQWADVTCERTFRAACEKKMERDD